MDRLLAIMRCWRTNAAKEGHDPEEIDLSFVCERLLRAEVVAFWDEVEARTGQRGPPKSEESWERMGAALRSLHRKRS
jgi:hypothetical protein